ncbi:MAG TPA: hypothetical protein PLA44_02730 [Propionibacteriaceae bacterium]|nr:hypothetical protein [Propionibacteriaceae bacterium]
MTTTAARPKAPAQRTPVERLVLMALGGVSLLAGLNAALLLLDVWAPVKATHLPDVHGQIMVLGFLGTLISLERAQALRKPWAYLAPGLLGAGGIALAFGATALGQLLQIEGAVAFVAVYLALHRRAPFPLVAVQLLSAVLALASAWLLRATDPATVLPLLAGFIVLTIASERAELAQLALGRRAIPVLATLSCVITLGATTALVVPQLGSRLTGAGMLAMAVWLARDDVARRQVRLTGFPRYNGTALLVGYVWLGLAGLVWLIGGVPTSTAAYDIVIHATFLGFAVSMVMAHAPTILPAVIGRPLPYKPISWLPLVVLHVGLLVRVVGDVADQPTVWRPGSVVTVVAMLLFVLVSASLVVRRGPKWPHV